MLKNKDSSRNKKSDNKVAFFIIIDSYFLETTAIKSNTLFE